MADNPYAGIMTHLNSALGSNNSNGIMDRVAAQNNTNYDWIGGAAPKAALPPTTPAGPTPDGDPWGWHGFLDNPIGKATGLYYAQDVLGKGYNALENAPILPGGHTIHDLNGIIKGVSSTQPTQPTDNGDGSYLGAYKAMGHNLLNSLNDMINSGVSGFKNPNQADQNFEARQKQIDTMFHDPVSKFMFNMEAGMGSDALTFTPTGLISDAIKAAKYGKAATAEPEMVNAFGGQYGLKGSGTLPQAQEIVGAMPGATAPATLDEAIANATKQEAPASVSPNTTVPTPDVAEHLQNILTPKQEKAISDYTQHANKEKEFQQQMSAKYGEGNDNWSLLDKAKEKYLEFNGDTILSNLNKLVTDEELFGSKMKQESVAGGNLKVGDTAIPTAEDGTHLQGPSKITDVQSKDGVNYYQFEGSNTYMPENQVAAYGRLKVSNDPIDYLNRAMGESKAEVSQKITPPYENPKELAKYVHDAVGGSLSDVRSLPYEDLRQLAEEHYQTLQKGNPFYDLSKSVAANHGYNLDDLFAGKTPNVMDRVAQDAQKRAYGIYPESGINIQKPNFTASAPTPISGADAVSLGLKPNAGWKLHISTDNPEELSNILKQQGVPHKVGSNGGQAGKDVTIYVGSKDQAQAIADSLEKNNSSLLKPPAGDALVDDAQFSNNIMGRFDANGDKAFHQYGTNGVPWTPENMQKSIFDKANFDPKLAEKESHDLLTKKYGDFYTGTELPKSDLSKIPDISANPDAMAAFGSHKASAFSKMLDFMHIGSGADTVSPGVRNAYLNGQAERASGGHLLDQFGAKTAENAHNAGHDTMSLNDLTHTYETTGVGHEAINPLVDLVNNGLEGTNAGLAKLTEHGIAPKELKPNYFPITLGKQNLMEKMGNIVKGKEAKMPVDHTPEGMNLSRDVTGESYNMDRQFQTLKQARAAGYNVDNPITAAVKTAKNHHYDVTNIKTLTDMKAEAIKSGEASKAPAAGLKYFTSKDPRNPMNDTYLSKGLHNLVTTEFVHRPWSQSNISYISPALQGYDKLMNLVRNITLYMPGVHNHNIFGNSMLGFGLDPQTWTNAEKAMAGKGSQAMNVSKAWAEKTGALHNDMHGNIETQIKRALDGKNAKGAYGRFQDKTLWDRERALRLGVFHDAFQEGLKRGLSEPQAANIARDVTNKNMIDYSKNNLSTFEREIMSRLDPYYKWHKGNYPLQFARLADPASLGRMIKTKDAEDKVQQEINGKHMSDNIGSVKERQFKWQLPLDKNGNSISFDPYLPQDEIFKMLDENPANFAYNRLASPIREVVNQVNNSKYYPSTTFAPSDQKHLADPVKYPIANPTDGFGQQMLDRLTHAVGGTFLPPDQPISTGFQALQEAAGKAPDSNLPTVPPLDKLLLSLSGGFPASTPMSQNKIDAQSYLENNFMAKNALNAWKADHPGERVPPAVQNQIAHQYGLKSIK